MKKIIKNEFQTLGKEANAFFNEFKQICSKNKRIYSKKIAKALFKNGYSYKLDKQHDDLCRKRLINY